MSPRTGAADRAQTLKVFLCYRRKDNAHATDRLFDRLVDQFGRENIFYDVDSIPIGVNWRTYVTQRVAVCDVFLAAIGDTWLEELNRRIGTDDLVRIEIESSLGRGIPIIPIQVGQATLPRRESLPPTIADLADWQGVPLRPGPDFAGDMQRLLDRLKELARAFDPLQAPPIGSVAPAGPKSPQTDGRPGTTPTYVDVRQAGEVTVVSLRVNKVTMDYSRAIELELKGIVDGGSVRIVLNVARATYIDSSGIGTLVASLRRARQANGDLRLCGLQSKIQNVLQMMSLHLIFGIYDSEAAAIASFQRGPGDISL